MTCIIVYLSFEKGLEEREGEIKNLSESSLEFSFYQEDCRKRDFARPKLH